MFWAGLAFGIFVGVCFTIFVICWANMTSADNDYMRGE